MHGEFAPSSYWSGLEVVYDLPAPIYGIRSLTEAFAAAITDLAGDAATIGIKLSGGLDSLAVLVHAAALKPPRRLIAFTTDMIDDAGRSSVAVVRRLLENLGPRVDLVVIDPARCKATPCWSPYGPRLDALPAINATTSEMAASVGVDVLLSGDGADELLAVPRFASMTILRMAGWRAVARYAADSARSGPGLPGEILATASAWLPQMTRAKWYWAANWPDWCRPSISSVVPTPLRAAALHWAKEWIDSTIRGHAEAARSWAQADAHDAFWPRGYTPAAGLVPEGSPFLQSDFVAAALGMPLAARYDPAAPVAYHRCKAQVIRLFPTHIRPTLPTRKQYFTRTLARSVAGSIDTPRAIAARLIDPQALGRERDTAVRMMALAVETWLAGAVAAGAKVPSRIDPTA